MTPEDKLAKTLLAHAVAKPHVVLQAYVDWEYVERPVEEFDATYDWVVEFPINNDATMISYSQGNFNLAVSMARMGELVKEREYCDESDFAERGGHSYITIDLKTSVSFGALCKLVDESYDTVWRGLGHRRHRLIECNGLPDDISGLFEEWIEHFGFSNRRQELFQIAKPSVLLGTVPAKPSLTTVGQSHIGGEPDLLPETAWPQLTDGKPLTFLAQLDLAELHKHGFEMPGVPQSGLLSVFSAWGWQDEGCYDPKLVYMDYENGSELNALIYTSPDQIRHLVKRGTPAGLNSFDQAQIHPVPFLSFPNEWNLPPEFKLSDEEEIRYSDMKDEYQECFLNHLRLGGDHQVGGFRYFVHSGDPKELKDKSYRMILKLGSDDHANMAFGDGGAISFHTLAATVENVFEEPITCFYD